jgi:low affinity Fe/Cu permease
MSSPKTGLTRFDRLASAVSNQVSRAWFFALCVLLVVIWLPSFFFFTTVDTWQLVINTMTTIVTFLLVALLQNTQFRADRASQQKLNALVEAMADLMEAFESQDPTLVMDVEELRRASGLEEREGT